MKRHTVILTAALALLTIRQAANAQFAGGSGTAEDPWLVADAVQLDAVRTNLTAHFLQTADIDLGVAPWNEGAGWVPLGTATTPFTGGYDGGRFAIRNLTVNRAASTHQGLFAALSGASVRKLRLDNVSVKGAGYTGALAGLSEASTLDNIRVSGDVTGADNTGGLLGRLTDGAMNRISTAVAVLGANYTGGVAGYCGGNASARYLCAAGQIQGGSYVGGLLGRHSGTTSTTPEIADSWSRAPVSGLNDVGGAVGYMYYSRVVRCFSAGAVSVTGGGYRGGLLGYANTSASISDSYWDTEASGQTTSMGGTGLTTAQTRQQNSFPNWNFNTLWRTGEGIDCPVFQDVCVYEEGPQALTPADLAGAGTAETPYLIGDADGLNVMRQNLAAHYRLTNDIDLAASVAWNSGQGWAPVGSSSAPFAGALEGAGFAIRNLTVNRPGANYQGLFGALSGATIRNLRLERANVRGLTYVGALVGHMTSGTLENIGVQGEITGAGTAAGGVIGYVMDGQVAGIAASVSVRGGDNTGGVAGQTAGNTAIRHAAAAGSVNGNHQAGGVVGRLSGSSSTTSELADSFSLAAVAGVSYVGGAVGYMYYSRCSRCYSAGGVSASGTDSGGFLGQASTSATTLDCYWDVERSGLGASDGGTGLTTAQARQRASYKNWNFFTLWQVEEGAGDPLFRNTGAHAAPEVLTPADFAGAGTAETPYLIGDADGLNVMRQNLAAHYRLTNDIDLAASVAWNTQRGWEPVGSSSAPFTGTLDGAGFAIRNLTVNRPGANYQGFFGFLSGATVLDLRLEDASVRGAADVGALAGQATSSTLRGISVRGEVTGSGNYVGGLAGYVSDGTISASRVETAVRGAADTGGIAGYAQYDVTLLGCFSAGSVQGADNAGGLVGYLTGSSSTRAYAFDSHSRAAVSGASRAGGAFGYANYASVFRCHSAGAVSGTGSGIGGFLGLAGTSYLTVGDCFWDTESSGQSASARGTGLTMAQARQRASYTGFNFFTLWHIDEGIDAPVLLDCLGTAAPVALTLDDLDGDGTEASPYLVSTPQEMNAVRLGLTSHFQLASDIDMASTAGWNGGLGWSPVGTSASAPFTGTFNGAGHAVLNLAVNRPRNSYQGLFGYLDGAAVKNLRLENASVCGADNTGGLAGYADGASVEDVHVTGQIKGGSYTGGVLGYMNDGLLYRASLAGAVRGGNYTGGIVGCGRYTTSVRYVFSLGAVLGGDNTGGLCGYHVGSSGGAAYWGDSFSRMSVDGGSSVGGAFGYMSYAGAYRCYSSGSVRATGTYAGGFLGKAGTSGVTVNDCYWDVEASGQAASARGTGLTTAQMRQQASFPGWDFSVVWAVEETVDSPWLLKSGHTLALGLDTRRHPNGASEGHALEVLANTGWSASTEASWITLTAGTAGTNDGVVVYSLSSNTVPASRSGTVTISSGVDVARVFTVIQGAELSIGATEKGHDAAASGGHRIPVDGDVAWRAAAAGAEWIVLTAGAEGAGTGTVVYAVTENLALEPRTNWIAITGGGLSATCAVVQAGARTYLGIAPDWRGHSAAGASGETVGVTANHGWTATHDTAWITVTSGENGSGDGTVTYAVDANTGLVSRLGHVIVSDGERTYRFRVNQVAANSVIITVAADPPESGLVSGGWTCALGQQVTVRATDSASHVFTCWNNGEGDVSSNAVYAFTAAADRHLTARYTLRKLAVNYMAGAGGSLAGETSQLVYYGSNGTAVAAQPAAGALFRRWSDGGTEWTRTDTDVRSNLTVTAVFRSVNGADLDWYAARGIVPEAGEDWADVDARAVPDKGTTLLQENTAATDPGDTNDVFRVTGISGGPPVAVAFTPASAARVYTLQATTNLTAGPWISVQGPRPGAGWPDAMNDEGAVPLRFYRVKVEVP